MASDKDQERAKGMIAPQDRDELRRRAAEIGSKLEAAKGRKPVSTGELKAQGAGLSLAFRFMIELLVGVCVGAGIGWFLDGSLGTQPWLLIVFLFLGFAAGMVNMIRAAQKEQAKYPVPANAKAVADDDEDGR